MTAWTEHPLRILRSLAATALIFLAAQGWTTAHELTDNLWLGGVLAGAVQCQQLGNDTAGEDTCRGAVPLQPELNYQPSASSRLFLKLGFAAGNGLNEVTPFIIPTWGADLEDDVKDINGSGRDHVLEAWYQHVIEFQPRNRLGVTLGLIDATQYLDQNAYANDEYTQFMNPSLSNAPNSLLPSYDLGIAAEWLVDNWSFSGVVMDVHQSTSPDTYTFYGLQAGYRLESRLGTGNYRLMLNADRNLVDLTGRSRQENDILLVSADQRFGRLIGGFIRVGWRIDDRPINYSAIYSAGIDIRGAAWQRLLDNVGIGLAYLDGANNRIANTRIFETYYRLVINQHLAITADIQYNRDELVRAPTAQGVVYSLRTTIHL